MTSSAEGESQSAISAIERVKSIGAVISGLLGLVMALSPLFGEKGLVYVTPPPSEFSAIVPSLTTVFACAFLAFIIISYFRGEIDVVKARILALLCFLAGAIGYFIYLSWVRNGQVDSPSVSTINGGLFSLLILTLVISAFSSMFVLLAIALISAQPTQSSNAVTMEKSPLTVAPPHKPAGADSLTALFRLVDMAEWEEISKESRVHRYGYWELFKQISIVILTEESLPFTKRKDTLTKRKAALRARSWHQFLLAIKILTPLDKNNSLKHHYLLYAKQFIDLAIKQTDLSLEMSTPDVEPRRLFEITVKKIGLALASWWPLYEVDHIYFTLKQQIKCATDQYESLDPMVRWELDQDATIQFPAHREHAETLQQEFLQFMNDVLKQFYTGNMDNLADLALDFEVRMKQASAELPPLAVVGRYHANHYRVWAYIFATASLAHELEKANTTKKSIKTTFLAHELLKADTTEKRIETTEKFYRAIVSLSNESIELGQGLSACRLANELCRIVQPMLSDIDAHKPELGKEVRRVYGILVANAEQTRKRAVF